MTWWYRKVGIVVMRVPVVTRLLVSGLLGGLYCSHRLGSVSANGLCRQ
jgi:hypothetical protein